MNSVEQYYKPDIWTTIERGELPPQHTALVCDAPIYHDERTDERDAGSSGYRYGCALGDVVMEADGYAMIAVGLVPLLSGRLYAPDRNNDTGSRCTNVLEWKMSLIAGCGQVGRRLEYSRMDTMSMHMPARTSRQAVIERAKQVPMTLSAMLASVGGGMMRLPLEG